MRLCSRLLIVIGLSILFAACPQAADETMWSVPLSSRIKNVQPMTGIVFWEELSNHNSEAIQLEFSYMRYCDVVKVRDQYDWSVVDRKLEAVASRHHQAILRFWDTYPGRPSAVPDYIKALPDYRDIVARSEDRDTGFPDWSHPEYQRFFLEFYQKFAERYDNDPRLAFLETGFGLWAEYHVYSGPEEPGNTFPSKEFQTAFFKHLSKVLVHTPWMISKDAHDGKRTPFPSEPALLRLRFGLFDDSFHLAWEPGYNLDGWTLFGRERYRESPMGGEILFPTRERHELVDANWAAEARNFGITFMICEQWLRYATHARIKQHSMACGYKFRITRLLVSDVESRVTVTNTGAAPIYYDAWIAINGVRAAESLKYLQPGEARTCRVKAGGTGARVTIECDRLVPGQVIEYDADLP